MISPAGPVRNLDGQVIKDSSGDIGFPGYDGMTAVELARLHPGHADARRPGHHHLPERPARLVNGTGDPFGPGQAGYEKQLKTENAAFGTFFSGLAAHGITTANTLFVITADEGDHFVGSAPTPAGCNGVTVPCHYSKIGEVDGNLTGLLAAKGITTPFDVEADSAPGIYVHGQPGRTNPAVRALEQATARLTGRRPGDRPDPAAHQLPGRPGRAEDPAHGHRRPQAHPHAGAVRQRQLLAVQRSGRAAASPASPSPRAATPGTTARRLADQHHLAGHGRAGRRAPRHRQLGLVRPHQHPADDDGAAAAARRLRAGRPGAGRDHRPRPPGRPGCARTAARCSGWASSTPSSKAPVGAFGLDTLRASTRALASNSAGRRELHQDRGPVAAARQRSGTRSARGCRRLLLGAAFDGRTLNVAAARALIRAGDRVLGQAAVLGAARAAR